MPDSPTREMDALELLTQQHRQAMELFKKIEETEDAQEGRRLFEQLKHDLQLHEDLEERALYPRLKQDSNFKEDAIEAYQEHHVMDVLLREISALGKDSEVFKAKVKVLEENTKHHAEEEEEGKLFPEIRQRWDRQRLEQIGLEMQALMREIQRTPKAA